jgi:hypothetical protein
MSDDRLPYRLWQTPRRYKTENSTERTSRKHLSRVVVTLLLGSAILALPGNPTDFDFAFPLEILAIALFAALLPPRLFQAFRFAATAILGAILFLKLADVGTGLAFQRPFNPYLDFKIIADGWNLLSGTLGRFEAAAVVALGFAVWLGIVTGLFWSLGSFQHLPRAGSRALVVTMSVGLLGGGAFLAISGPGIPLSTNMAPYLTNRITMIRQSAADLTAFEREIGSDPLGDLPIDGRFASLGGQDVVVIFIESYGRSAVEDELYRTQVQARLRDLERSISSVGLEARSGWLTSPTVAGLSWLAHGALLSGLWTDNQARYDRMIASRRPTLNALFRDVGWRTTAVMPAITMAWPESAYFGYDTVRDAAGLGYRGKPFNWVTMPDQYTLAAFERLDRPAGHPPVMAEIALISSHAPWTPVPTLIGWNEIGDGRIFNAQAEAGDPPSVVWSDPARVRSQYLASIDHVLELLASYIPQHSEDTLFILVGDHQPAAIITGQGASRDVPMHIIGRPRLLDRISDWNWSKGTIPAPELTPLRMDLFREKFVRSFSSFG